MTGDEFKAARIALGERWGLGRMLTLAETARILRLAGGDAARDMARRAEITGPASALMTLYLRGVEPPDGRPVGTKDVLSLPSRD